MIASLDAKFLVLPKLQEFCVKKKDQIEVVSMIGVFGFLVTLCEMYPSPITQYARIVASVYYL